MIIDANNWTPTTAQGFIVLEGTNGAGKTTQQDNAIKFFQQQGWECLKTREPGAGELGAEIRRLALSSNLEISPLSELLLFEADRAQHVDKIIRPALAQNKVVISDRYYYSSESFQGYGRGLDLKLIRELNEIAIQGLKPDLCILLDLDPYEGIKRTNARNNIQDNAERDRFEEAKLDFHQRIRNGFLEIAERTPEPFLIIDASQNIDDVWKQIEHALLKLSTCLKK